MGMLQSSLTWFGRRCYLIFESIVLRNRRISSYSKDDVESTSKIKQAEKTEVETKQTAVAKIENEQIATASIEIENVNETSFKHSFHVSKSLFPYIIGQKFRMHKKLQDETGTTIHIPQVHENCEDIVILGGTYEAVISARRKIDSIIENSKSKLKPTHFLSIPFNKNDIMNTFESFKNDVLENYGKTAKVDSDFFQKPPKLHITIGVLILLNDREINAAIKALQYCKEEIINPVLKQHGSIKIQLKGVQCMGSNPTKVKVLYADIVQNEIVQKLINDVAQYFIDAGLMKKEKREHDGVKLHVTIMNSRFKIKNKKNNWRDKGHSTFDATDIINNYKDWTFGEINLEEIHLSQFHAKSENGYYLETTKIELGLE